MRNVLFRQARVITDVFRNAVHILKIVGSRSPMGVKFHSKREEGTNGAKLKGVFVHTPLSWCHTISVRYLGYQVLAIGPATFIEKIEYG